MATTADAAEVAPDGELDGPLQAGFDGVIVALLRDDGQLKKLHDAVAQIDVCVERQYEAVAKVVKGE